MIKELIIEGLRKKYDIPENAEDIGYEQQIDYGGCCHNYGDTEVSIFYWYVPKGRKRKTRRFHTYNGSLESLIDELDYQELM